MLKANDVRLWLKIVFLKTTKEIIAYGWYLKYSAWMDRRYILDYRYKWADD